MQTGVTHVVVMEGINDIGIARNNPSPSADDLIAGHKQLIELQGDGGCGRSRAVWKVEQTKSTTKVATITKQYCIRRRDFRGLRGCAGSFV
jgi:lysophospholipase L1-like esterase